MADCRVQDNPHHSLVPITIVMAVIIVLLSAILFRVWVHHHGHLHTHRFSRLLLVESGQVPKLTLAPGQRWHVYLSHVWSSGQDQAHQIRRELLQLLFNVRVFLDIDDLEAVSKIPVYIQASGLTLFFLSKGYFDSKNCMLEVDATLRSLPDAFILVRETFAIHGGQSLCQFIAECPPPFREKLFSGRTAIEYHRRQELRQESLVRMCEAVLLTSPEYLQATHVPLYHPKDLARCHRRCTVPKRILASANNPGAAALAALLADHIGDLKAGKLRLEIREQSTTSARTTSKGSVTSAAARSFSSQRRQHSFAVPSGAQDPQSSQAPFVVGASRVEASVMKLAVQARSTIVAVETAVVEGAIALTRKNCGDHGQHSPNAAQPATAHGTNPHATQPATTHGTNPHATQPATVHGTNTPTSSHRNRSHRNRRRRSVLLHLRGAAHVFSRGHLSEQDAVLILLNDEAFRGEKGDKLAAEVKAALEHEMRIVLVHELRDGAEYGSCEFATFFARVPVELAAVLFRHIACPLHTPPHLAISISYIASKIGASVTPLSLEQLQAEMGRRIPQEAFRSASADTLVKIPPVIRFLRRMCESSRESNVLEAAEFSSGSPMARSQAATPAASDTAAPAASDGQGDRFAHIRLPRACVARLKLVDESSESKQWRLHSHLNPSLSVAEESSGARRSGRLMGKLTRSFKPTGPSGSPATSPPTPRSPPARQVSRPNLSTLFPYADVGGICSRLDGALVRSSSSSSASRTAVEKIRIQRSSTALIDEPHRTSCVVSLPAASSAPPLYDTNGSFRAEVDDDSVRAPSPSMRQTWWGTTCSATLPASASSELSEDTLRSDSSKSRCSDRFRHEALSRVGLASLPVPAGVLADEGVGDPVPAEEGASRGTDVV